MTKTKTIGIPHFSILGFKSYLEFYFEILDALSEDFEDNELISYPIKENEESEIIYQFYINGLRKAVLTETLDTLSSIDGIEDLSTLLGSKRFSEQSDIQRLLNLISLIKSVNDKWNDEAQYNHNQK